MSAADFRSWGRLDFGPQHAIALAHRAAALPDRDADQPLLAFGNGRSYGDSCQNGDGTLIDMRRLDRFISFDDQTGVLTCEAGVLLADILRLVIPRGWYLPVVPGTQFVTVGGAIANDVHGKNHAQMGTFGGHVRRFELLRSDGARHLCSGDANADLFAATIAGLGLTGIIVWAELQLRPVKGPWMSVETQKFQGVADYLALDQAARSGFEYRVAWVDCLAGGGDFARGVFSRANHAEVSGDPVGDQPTWPRRHIPATPPFSCVTTLTARLFNAAYYRRQALRAGASRVDHARFFFPLDAIRRWNRLYGPRGFFQHQSVLPSRDAAPAVEALLHEVVKSGLGSPLVVLKSFGDTASPGMLSFPKPGLTLAVDIRNTGEEARRLLARMDAIVVEAQGAIYPAKDAAMSATTFRAGYPGLDAFRKHLDPAFSSAFWRRVEGANLNLETT
jgi:FAD/FMN-containing dehydrogenase